MNKPQIGTPIIFDIWACSKELKPDTRYEVGLIDQLDVQADGSPSADGFFIKQATGRRRWRNYHDLRNGKVIICNEGTTFEGDNLPGSILTTLFS